MTCVLLSLWHSLKAMRLNGQRNTASRISCPTTYGSPATRTRRRYVNMSGHFLLTVSGAWRVLRPQAWSERLAAAEKEWKAGVGNSLSLRRSTGAYTDTVVYVTPMRNPMVCEHNGMSTHAHCRVYLFAADICAQSPTLFVVLPYTWVRMVSRSELFSQCVKWKISQCCL